MELYLIWVYLFRISLYHKVLQHGCHKSFFLVNGQVAIIHKEFIILDKGKHFKYETYAKRADVKSTA